MVFSQKLHQKTSQLLLYAPTAEYHLVVAQAWGHQKLSRGTWCQQLVAKVHVQGNKCAFATKIISHGHFQQPLSFWLSSREICYINID